MDPTRPRNDMASSMANSTNCANLRLGNTGLKNGYIPGKLPLPDDYFSVPQLSSKENKYLLGLAKHACKEVVYYSRQNDGPMKWLHLSSDDGVDVFQGVDRSNSHQDQDPKALTYLRGSCKIRATIDEISDFFKLDTVDKLSGFTQTVGKDVLDQKTLLTLAKPTPDNPKHYVAVKWTAIESPSKLARNRDFCYIECHDEFIDTNTKRRGWVRSIHSIRLPFCPPLNKSHGLVRGSLYRSGFIFTESAETGCVDAVHTLHVDIKGSTPNWMKILVMKRRIKNIAEVDRHFQRMRLTHGRLLGDLELPTKDGVTRCQLCETRFGIFHRRRRCRKCGKVVCTSCGDEFLLDYAGMGPRKVRICSECSESVASGVTVPVRDAKGEVVADKHTGAKQIQEDEIHPMYDDSPSGSVALLQSRQLSIEEHEFYMKNEDESGIADMEEAKRMNKEFEEMLMKTTDENSEQNGQHRRFNPVANSLLDANSASGETVPVETPRGELPPWEERRGRDQRAQDAYDDDDELGLPPSKSEQMRKQLQYEEQMRREHIERAKKLHQHATGGGFQSSDYFSTASTELGEQRVEQRPRPQGIVRNESGDSLRMSSEWGDEYYVGRGGMGSGVMTSFHSNESGSSGRGGVARSELSGDGLRSRSGSHGATSASSNEREYRYVNGGIPRHRGETAHRIRNDSGEDGRSVEDEFDRQRRTQHYFDMRNARLAMLNGQGAARVDPSRPQFTNNDGRLFEYEQQEARRFRSSGSGAGSDPPVRRQLTGSELESPYTSLSDSNIAGAFTPRRRYRSDDLADRDDEAFRLAMSAMRLYEEERGPKLHVSDETRQAALAKMMEVYAREIERSHDSDSGPYNRGTISDTRRVHHDIGMAPPLRRAVSDDHPSSFYGSPLQVFSQDGFVPAPRRHQRRAATSKYSQDLPREDSYAPSLGQKTSEETHEYRDLSDLTSSAFQAFQMNSLGPRDAPKLPIKEAENSDDSDSEFQPAQDHAQPSSVQRESTSTTHVQLKSDTSGGAARATYGSIESSEATNMVSRPNSMYGVADSDTFSDMDLIDLPHLMRKDDVEAGARNSFADLRRWTEDTRDEGVEYPPGSRLSGLLSPLHLEGVQHVEDDDSESQSSNASSQIDWQNSLANKFPGGQGRAETDSESSLIRAYPIAHQNEVEPPSPSELLSEYTGSERSSLPSYLEFGGSQPELEPEYLQAIENSRLNGNDRSSIPVEGGRRGHVRRRSSIPSEVESITSRELFL
ncbi:hypothetical protein PR003_g3768 [Phytophthora rubi]|uniref:FYVE-type domain-containing protein n=1 Tax=Phytophthora rubi TaxID=129364 RepID=A0A6A3P904_9STRA|nr:hypothetical protein PR001_g3623 [Phytophthora rubi]KAE9353627.1 hypothetical protein PR003_g3768 [Phytophthora rubi]